MLDLVGDLVPSIEWFVYAFVRKEAVLSAQIEGTQATLMDLLQVEASGEEPTDGDWEGWLAYFLEGVAVVAAEAVTTARRLHVIVAEGRARLLARDDATVMSNRLFELLKERSCRVVIAWAAGPDGGAPGFPQSAAATPKNSPLLPFLTRPARLALIPPEASRARGVLSFPFPHRRVAPHFRIPTSSQPGFSAEDP